MWVPIFLFLAIMMPFNALAEPHPAITACWEKQKVEKASNVAVAECLHETLKKLETRRKEAEYKGIQKAKEYDETEVMMGHKPPNVSAMEESEKKFEEYRKSECWRQRYLLGAGSLAGHVQMACEIRITQQRIDELQ